MKTFAQPFVQISDLAGVSITSGLMYVGNPNQNPETSPQVVFWDSAGLQPAAQPLVLSGGHIVRDGKIADLFIQGDYSLTIRSKKGVLIFSKLFVSTSNILSGGVAGSLPYQSAPDTTAFLSPGTAGAILVSGGAGSPGWTASPAVVTQPITDRGTTAASTAFVRSVSGGVSKLINVTTGTPLVLTAADVGAFVESSYLLGLTSATLPQANAIPSGLSFEFSNHSSAISSFAISTNSASPADRISINGVLATTYSILPNEGLRLYSDGSGIYKAGRVVSSKRTFQSPWVAGLPVSTTVGLYTYAHGLGTTPTNVRFLARAIAAVSNGYVLGDVLHSVLFDYTGLGLTPNLLTPAQVFASPTLVSLTTPQVAPNGCWASSNAGSREMTQLTPSLWEWCLVAE